MLAIGVAKGVGHGRPRTSRRWPDEALALIGADPELVEDDDVEIDARWMGPDYGVPTAAGAEAIRWAAVHGGWVLDDTYTGKGFAGLLGNAATGRWRPGTDVVFLHTGGLPGVFAVHGTADPTGQERRSRQDGAGSPSRQCRRRPCPPASAGNVGGAQHGAERRVPVRGVAGAFGGPRPDVEVRGPARTRRPARRRG